MGQFEKAPLYHQLGVIKWRQEEHKEAIIYYEKSICIEEKITPLQRTNLADSYTDIGVVYYVMDEYSKTLSIQQQSLPLNRPDLSSIYANIGLTCEQMKNYSQALFFFEKSFEIAQKSLPENHPDRIKNKL